MTDTDLLRAMMAAGGVNLDVDDLLQCAPTSYTRSNLSSRLCRMREKGLCVSEYELRSKRNYWSVSNIGAALLNPVPDIAEPVIAHEFVAEQCADTDVLPDMPNSLRIEAGCGIDYSFTPIAVADILVSESQRLHRRNRFSDLPDALFVLESLGDYCADMPGYQGELVRIADYLRANAA